MSTTQVVHTALMPCWRRCYNLPTTATSSIIPMQRSVWVPLTITGNANTNKCSRMIRCMANPRRVKMVAKQIRRELSDMLITDNVLQFAILPEASLGADSYLSSVTTITDVQITTDLQVVRVYVSVFGDARGKEVAMAGLKSKAKYVRSELGRRMKLRLTPEIRFIEDESFERGSRVIEILDKIKNEKSGTSQSTELLDSSANEDDIEQLSSSENDDDADWDDEDPDEGIIYVE
ncbi:probable ribosome-binding factor A, chloroplastic [Cicer arietinum]|uniref:Probable ribosome-binding factor A, chloroplastic n=1 Tax=Cicer arietinum TaxID=3827 RepID=A0A1S3E7M0_CICAR|nr:probable ribosome-binding factor A, chloroplastic [Cicer arietinum]XP_012571404.1 probable ribosome-binding factor A, chloroplastic [Cicer arietinum]XP_012571405.1 probable ribosome-binding factor A, chloroplastic [Cicer arietinum]XP_012571406.1 probable ribosome-binding factor A, chloroplastic [Cicer arietinum]XP_012571407.1 probable ribosome-binding factor A, chloroplastic [Cicer arietinum]XP_012571408.1 probable ribosome-binding factor A, chloroplastic [Cicer arietinum]XP_012571409.1 pr